MSAGHKIEAALSLITDEIINALETSPHMTQVLLATIETLQDVEPLVLNPA